MDTQPYHRRFRPTRQIYSLFASDRAHIDLSYAHMEPYGVPDPVAEANRRFDRRAAAAVITEVSGKIYTAPSLDSNNPDEVLIEGQFYPGAFVYILRERCLGLMAFADYFLDLPNAPILRGFVSDAIMKATPGWCGTYGPDVGDQGQTNDMEGNYDFKQMFMLALVYNFYDELRPEARERLITALLAQGRIHRANVPDTLTSGGAPNDWSRAGYAKLGGVNVADIPETENHVLMIATARYLTNQLLYQRNHDPNYDNRRNGDRGDSRPICMDQVLSLLRNYLRDDFAEYNAKNYQEETRHALLNLCSYAYDAEVRLGARMVLDYISAHIAVSSNDLRRMVPFRRRNEGINIRLIAGEPGFMDVSLLDAHGADPMSGHFALLAGNTRAYRNRDKRDWQDGKANRIWDWAITGNFGADLTLGALSSYRLPPSIHDLFVNDLHRRFFQRLHRHPLEEPGQQRNCDNMEIYAGSPSYLITAGGEPAPYVIPGVSGFGFQDQNLGVAVPTSFMPTGLSAERSPNSLQQLGELVGKSTRPISLKAVAQEFGISVPFSFKQLSAPAASRNPNPNAAGDLIQFSHFSNIPKGDSANGGNENYGVAPDFACGYVFHLPAWTAVPLDKDGVFFVNRKSHGDELPGFFLAIIKEGGFIFNEGGFILMEAFDTWLHPEVSFEQFQQHVRRDNPNIHFKSDQETVYTTYYGNRIHFVIWHTGEHDYDIASKILKIEYGAGDPADTLVEAGNDTDPSHFLSGTVLKSAGDAVVEIHNTFLGQKIKLDWGNPSYLARTSEDGTVEEAGRNGAGQYYEVWVDFNWTGPFVGDFFRPFNTIAAAASAVANGGVIKIAPGTTSDRTSIRSNGKRIRLVAPIGGVTIGAH